VNNAIKHSDASRISVLLDFSHINTVDLNIRDNGKGIASYDGGFGLRSMKERVQLVNGKVEIVSAPGEGVQLHIEVPG
jgi:signal transduction histidine kinase